MLHYEKYTLQTYPFQPHPSFSNIHPTFMPTPTTSAKATTLTELGVQKKKVLTLSTTTMKKIEDGPQKPPYEFAPSCLDSAFHTANLHTTGAPFMSATHPLSMEYKSMMLSNPGAATLPWSQHPPDYTNQPNIKTNNDPISQRKAQKEVLRKDFTSESDQPQLEQPLRCQWVIGNLDCVCNQHFAKLNAFVEHLANDHVNAAEGLRHVCLWKNCQRNGQGRVQAKYKLEHLKAHGKFYMLNDSTISSSTSKSAANKERQLRDLDESSQSDQSSRIADMPALLKSVIWQALTVLPSEVRLIIVVMECQQQISILLECQLLCL
uniref:C2H2-type domain-containing protein n=1 Tax=Ditylenchus dipsaci TaxID=166011 RepID=A0A915DQV7_9BILA